MEEILHNLVNTGTNHLSTGAGFLPSTVVGKLFGEIDDVLFYATNGVRGLEKLRTPDVAAFLGTVRWFRAPRALATSARRARAIENVPCGDQEGDFLVEIG